MIIPENTVLPWGRCDKCNRWRLLLTKWIPENEWEDEHLCSERYPFEREARGEVMWEKWSKTPPRKWVIGLGVTPEEDAALTAELAKRHTIWFDCRKSDLLRMGLLLLFDTSGDAKETILARYGEGEVRQCKRNPQN